MTATGYRPKPAATGDPGRPASATARRVRARRRLGGALASVLLVTGTIALAGCSNPQPPTTVGAQPATTAASPREPLLDLNVRPRTRRELVPAIDLLRRHGELAGQQVRDVQRRERNSFAKLQVSDRCGVVSDCRDDITSAALYDQELRTCLVDLYMSEIRKEAAELDVPIPRHVATMLVHEQEHCLDDDGGERPAVQAEIRLAREIGDHDDPAMQEYFQIMLADIGPDGSWRDMEGSKGSGR